jgi:hypothetical protein
VSKERAREELALPLAGYRLAGCLVDHGLNMSFTSPAGRSFLKVEGWMRYTTAEGSSPEVSALDAQAAGIAKRMVGRMTEKAIAHPDGDLTIKFDDGSRLHVEADREYYAWEFISGSGWRVLSGPGGALATGQMEPEGSKG